MPVNMTADIDRHRKSGDMGRIGFDMNPKHRGGPSESCRPDPEPVEPILHLFLQKNFIMWKSKMLKKLMTSPMSNSRNFRLISSTPFCRVTISFPS